MAFIDTSDTLVGVEITQNDARYVKPGQPIADLQVRARRRPDRQGGDGVPSHLDGTGAGLRHGRRAQGDPVGSVKLDDDALAKRLPAGSTGTAAIFTEAVKVTHVIRKILLWQIAILNYVNPF
jgi:hypothetical protein